MGYANNAKECIIDSNNPWVWEYSPLNLSWDIEHIHDSKPYEAIDLIIGVATKVSFNEASICFWLNEWHYINNLMDVQDDFTRPTLQGVPCHSTFIP